MAIPLQLAAVAGETSTIKIIVTAKLAGLDVSLCQGQQQTSTGLPAPELVLETGSKVQYTNAILRRVAQQTESGLMGKSFMEEGQVDSWLEWVSMEVDHLTSDHEAALKRVADVLESHTKTRTFLVGQRLTVADISAFCSLVVKINDLVLDEYRKKNPNMVRWFLTCKHHLSTFMPPAVSTAMAKPEVSKVAPIKPSLASTPVEPSAKMTAAPVANAPVTAAPVTVTPPAAVVADEAPGGGGKKEEKRKAKEEEKRKKEEEKRKREEERVAAAESKHKGPNVTLENFKSHAFGNLFVQSELRTDRTWTPVASLDPSLKETHIWVRARVHCSRKQGQKLTFLTLRQDIATVQAVVFGAEIAGFAGALPDESVVDIYGKLVCPEVNVASCSQQEVELNVENIYCLGRSQALPLQLADAGRPETDYEKDPTLVRVGQEVRLDNRVIDLRTVANQAIFRIQSGVCTLFREYLLSHTFQEIHTPKLIGGASEGGADVFRVDYFEGNAFLAQSPQLYKQMALMSDMPRVFEIGPIFRSERSFTHRHMTEFTGLDLEMTFKDHYHEVLEMLDGLFNHIFTGLNARFRREIDAVRQQYPFEDLKWKYPCLRLTFKEAVGLLRTKGPAILEARLKVATSDYEKSVIQRHLVSVREHEDEEDISTEDEKILGLIILEEYGEELYIIDKFPRDVRPFYTMPDPKDDRWTNAYDVFLRGEEITSGAQRIHEPGMLAEKAARLGISIESIQPYIDAFKYGSYPHAGAGIGMERVVMLFLQLPNIRKTSMFPRDPKRLAP